MLSKSTVSLVAAAFRSEHNRANATSKLSKPTCFEDDLHDYMHFYLGIGLSLFDEARVKCIEGYLISGQYPGDDLIELAKSVHPDLAALFKLI